MNTQVLRRKMLYVGAIVLLLVPLYFLGHPSVRDEEGTPTNEGGTLARLRTRDELGQSDLGALDPASESARLATLGLRGVAATILWQKAEHYKREKYYDRMAAAVNQLKVLQPHFVKVWDFQAHNLSYNVSADFDNYKHRYDWVKKGVYYLLEGCRYNKSRTELPFQIGDFLGSKMGVADEKLQYRELFRNDADFHREMAEESKLDVTQQAAKGPDGKPDNWRSGALWFDRSYDMVANGSRPAKSPLMFYCKSAQWQLKHSEAIQTEGHLGEDARNAWNNAAGNLKEFGQRQIRTSWGTIIYLTELEQASRNMQEKEEEFKQFCGDLFTEQYERQEKELTEEQQIAIKKDLADRSFEEIVAAERAQALLQVNPDVVARNLPPEKQIRGLEIANELKQIAIRRRQIDQYRQQVNYSYWESRCQAEQEDAALAARTNMYAANQALDLGKLDDAINLYEEAWKHWNTLFSRHPAMMTDDAGDEVIKAITHYFGLKYEKQDLSDPPADFILKNFLAFYELQQEDLADPAMMSLIGQWATKYPGRDFLVEILDKSVAYQEVAQRLREEEEALMQGGKPDGGSTTPPSSSSDSKIKPAEKTDSPTEPAATEPAATEPAATEPAATEPAPTEPAPSEPAATEPAATEPAATEPAPSEQPQ